MCPSSSDYTVLDIPEVGPVKARRPMPDAVALLAMASNPKIAAQDRLNYIVRFARRHIDEADLEQVFLDMMLDRLPANTIELVARALATWGTARPYTAVISLTVMTAYHWRTIRQKLLMAGIAQPMTLPSMHVLLDSAEALAVESVTGGDNPAEELASLYRRLYGPTPDGPDTVPAGFDPDEMEDAFDAFARVAG